MTNGGVLIASVLVTVAFSGCLAEISTTPSTAATSDEPFPVSVVASIAEFGPNIYHDQFQLSDSLVSVFETFAELIGAEPFVPTVDGSVEERYNQDVSRLRALENGTLYWVHGTRIFGISFANSSGPIWTDSPQFSQNPHGTGVASRVLQLAPDAAVLMVTTNTIVYTEDPSGPDYTTMSKSLVNGTAWAARQPWIDVMTYSIGYPGNPPDGSPVTPDSLAFVQATRAATESGKLVVFGSGNFVAPPHAAPLAGPPWVVSVGGVRVEQQGNTWGSSKAPDFAAPYGVEVAGTFTENGTRQFGGTSSAAPGVAGAFARVVNALREEAGLSGFRTEPGPFVPEGAFGPGSPAIGPWEVRAAFNRSASYPEVTEWEPDTNVSTDWQDLVYLAANQTTPITPVLPATQIGWGFVNETEADAALQILLEYGRTGDRGLLEAPVEKGENVAFMEASYAFREGYWHAKAG